jgi:signal recognition particle subunit SRP72
MKLTFTDLCNATTDLTDTEKEAEILPMTVQQVYVLTQMGKFEEAEKISASIPFGEIKELSTRYIAQVNSIAASKEQTNPYQSHRLFHASPKPSKTDQHFSFQTNALRQDEYVMDLFSQKVAGVISSTSKTISASPAPTISPAVNTAAVFNAAAHAKNLTEKAALKEILPLLEKRPNDVGLLLTITNLYVLTNNHAAATHLLESFFKRLEQSGSASDLDVRHAPGLVATLVSLYAHQSRHAHSRSELAKAATYWRHKSKTSSKSLMVAAGVALLDTHNPENLSAAGDIFAKLFEQDEGDKAAVAGLVAAYSISESSRLSPDLVNSLPEASRLVSDIDAAALEKAGVPTLTSTAPITSKRAAPRSAVGKSKRIRKARMPKEFDPNKKLDAERWLPMRDRTYYRPKGKKGKKKMEGLTQGGPVAEEKAAGGQPTAGGGAPQTKKGGKKKGKGGKW